MIKIDSTWVCSGKPSAPSVLGSFMHYLPSAAPASLINR